VPLLSVGRFLQIWQIGQWATPLYVSDLRKTVHGEFGKNNSARSPLVSEMWQIDAHICAKQQIHQVQVQRLPKLQNILQDGGGKEPTALKIMTSTEYDIKKFFEIHKGKDRIEFLCRLHMEVTEAERKLYRKTTKLDRDRERVEDYVRSLKNVFVILKSSVGPFGVDESLLPYIEAIKSTKKIVFEKSKAPSR
jgi:hypothetical protein